MTCFTKSRIPTEEVKLEITLDGRPEKYEVTWGELWSSQPGYPLQLNESEIWWRDRYDMLARRGYRLLPRYSPDWKPSWIKPYDSYPEFTALKATFRPDKYEDTVAVPVRGGRIPAMFATRLLDGAQVVIKRVWCMDSGFDEELKTMVLVSSESLRDDPMNHCVQLLEWFLVEDEVEPELSADGLAFAVIPLLRDWRKPSFRLTVESLDFISQLIEGLAFMHKHNIAHRDIRSENLGMDPSTMFPSGMNPLVNVTTFFGSSRSPREPRGRKDRIDVPVKYLYFDFGESLSFPSYEERRIVTPPLSFHGYPERFEVRENRAEGEELWHDPFPGDIYMLGSVLEELFYKDMSYLRPLIDSMHQEDPQMRPTSMECLERFGEMKMMLHRWELLSPTSNMLHSYGYEHWWHKVHDVSHHRYEYLRLVAKATSTKKGRGAMSKLEM